MLKRSNFGKWLMLTLFISFLLCGFASADDNELDGSEYIDEDNSLPYSGSEILDEIKKDPQFIASRGSFSEVSDDYADIFSNPVCICWDNVTKKDQFFTEFDDSVIGFSYAGAGYIIVELESDSSEKVNETTVDRIYKIIDEYCEQEGISEVPVVFMWSHIEEDLPLPNYGPQIFEEIKDESEFIATRGTMPVITDESEKREWGETAGDCIHSFRAELGHYMLENGGSLVGYGYDYRGYIFVEFDKKSPENINESIIDEIYLIIDDNCEQEGVSEAPVVFEWGETPIEDEGLPPEDDVLDVDEKMITIMGKDGKYVTVDKDEVYLDKNGNFAIKDNDTAQKTNETTNQTPGFTSIMVILGLLSLLIIKRS